MKRLFIFIFFILFLISCSKTVIKTGAISEQNIINMSFLQKGMTQDKVLNIMGYPYKIERKKADNKIYEIWYYITKRILLGQSKLVTRNFTPLIFEKNHLKGWGRNYYKFIFDIDNEKQKRQMEKKQEYTDDKEEWPKNAHIIIPPMNEPKKENCDKKKDLNKKILELEKPDSKTQTDQIQQQKQTKNQKQKIIKEKNSQKVFDFEKQDKEIQEKPKEDLKKDKKESIDSHCKKAKEEKDNYIFWE